MLEGDGHILDSTYINLYHYINSKIDERDFDIEGMKLLKLTKYSKGIESYLFNTENEESAETQKK